MYEALLFDFDGTLVDTVEDIAFYANSVLADYGYRPCTVGQVKGAIGFGVHELVKTLAPSIDEEPQRLEKAVEAFRARYREEPVRKTRPFPGVTGMLSGPLAAVKKAIITNKPQDITLQILDRLKLASYFELVIGMHAGHPPKPDPSSILFAMRQLGAAPQACVYIGDSRVDAEVSKNAGIDFAWVSYGYDVLDGEKAAFKFESAGEWKKLLSR